MASHPREPIKHTCPDIDKYIKSIKYAIVRERDMKGLSESELFDVACSMAYELESCIDYLEELRSSNDTLRKWGIEEADRVDELEQEMANMEIPAKV